MKDRFQKLHAFLIETVLLPVKFYRQCISPRLGVGKCKYLPTCSEYALEALREWGLICGTVLAIWRIIRCNPFSKGGYDPVPKRK